MVIRDLLQIWDRQEVIKILSHYLMTSPGYVYAHLDDPVIHKVEELVHRAVALRKQGYPLQYILGRWDFYTLELKVEEGVLIPRPETELLVDCALHIANEHEWEDPSVLDVGFGSGAIALAVQKHLPEANVFGTDISRSALAVAEENKRNLGLDKVHFLEGDLFSAVEGECFDIIISNPPYLANHEKEHLQKELTFEPSMALFAGTEGLDVYERLIPEAPGYLKDGGYLLLEIGATQAESVVHLLEANGYTDISVQKDLSGLDRMILSRKLGDTPCSGNCSSHS